MEMTETIAFVRRYNAWRRGYDDSEMPHPKDIGHAIDALCDHAERMERDLEQERQDREQEFQRGRAHGAYRIAELEREIAVWKHEAKRLEAELQTFDETAIIDAVEKTANDFIFEITTSFPETLKLGDNGTDCN